MIRRRVFLLLLSSCVLVGSIVVGSAGGDDEASPGRIAYTVSAKGYGEIWIMDADGSNARRVTEPASDAPEDALGSRNPALSPDGTRIAYASVRDALDHFDLYVVGADGGKPERLTAGDTVADVTPAWSPDGERIAFSHSTGNRSVIEVMDADGANREQLTSDPAPRWGSDYDPTWSPDGKQIAFTRTELSDVGPIWAAIYVVDAAGGNERLLVNYAIAPAWSPDGGEILFAKVRNPYGGESRDECAYSCGFYVVNARGAGLRRLQASGPLDRAPAWSPDGDEIVFESTRPDPDAADWELYVMDANGTNVRRLTTNDVYDGDPDWR